MARKYDLISELYRRTAHAVVSDVQNWQAFLRCACRNYRLRFDEQLLIYAQRPHTSSRQNYPAQADISSAVKEVSVLLPSVIGVPFA